MGVDTKGFVLTHCKDVNLTAGLLERALNRIIRTEQGIQSPNGARRLAPDSKFRAVKTELLPSLEMARLSFSFNGEERSMHLHYGCDCDHVEHGPASLSMSLGCWGQSTLLMKVALHALSVLGPAYLDENDCDSQPYEPLTERRPTVRDCVGMGYITTYELPRWVAAWDAGQLRQAVDMATFFGAPESAVRAAVATPISPEFAQRVQQLIDATPVRLTFIDEFHEHQAGLSLVDRVAEAA